MGETGLVALRELKISDRFCLPADENDCEESRNIYSVIGYRESNGLIMCCNLSYKGEKIVYMRKDILVEPLKNSAYSKGLEDGHREGRASLQAELDIAQTRLQLLEQAIEGLIRKLDSDG